MISVIIVNYNAGAELAANIRRLLATSQGLGLELIVVDNASCDGSLEGLGAEVQLIRNPDNRGFAAACNQGIAASRGELLLFLNPDVRLEGPALQTVQRALEADAQAGMAGCLLVNPDGTEQRGCRRRIPDARRAFYRISGLSHLLPRRCADFNDTHQPLPTGASRVEAISGAFMLVKRAALEQVGRWDEAYFLHAEDLDLCQRFNQAGLRILFVPGARAVHCQGLCSRRRPVWVEWHKHRGMWRFYRKFQAPANPAPFNGLVRVGIALHFLPRSAVLLPAVLRRHGMRGSTPIARGSA